ncbi:U-box domain-containing protein [Seminavis robusta]|uniref:U-box domain-containing protein n=1 Tax=Seminavis robusta TaxID=568900 RepID=A0A9N8E6R6_9STRA|nr:U-box domain-containing protein [Seminavis robusta]|eukprot:Sro681_g186390.1 U-box domain-containing protein (315) ;mRNA; f:22850-23794
MSTVTFDVEDGSVDCDAISVDCDEIAMEMGLTHHQSPCNGNTKSSPSCQTSECPSDHANGVTTTRPPLLCPLTMQPLLDPVVNPTDGFSYERSAIIGEKDKDKYIPNRVLKDYLVAVKESAVASSSSRDGTRSSTAEHILTLFVCPITHLLLQDPIIDHEGNTYEHSAITDWVQQHGVSPITRNPLSLQQLYDNKTLSEVLLQETPLLQQQQVGRARNERQLQDEELGRKTPRRNVNELVSQEQEVASDYSTAGYRSLPVGEVQLQEAAPEQDINIHNAQEPSNHKKDALIAGAFLLGCLGCTVGSIFLSRHVL